MNFKSRYFASTALVCFCTIMLIVEPALANKSSITLFPPSNSSECNANTALMWDGQNSVRCANVVQVIPNQGTPLYLKQTPQIVGYSAINSIYEKAVAEYAGHPSDIDFIRGTCEATVNSGNIWSLQQDAACLIRFCQGYYGNPIQPAMAVLGGGCNAMTPDPTSTCYPFNGQPTLYMSCMYPAPISDPN